MDSFLNLQTWYQWERLITLAHLLVVRRPNSLLFSVQKNTMWDFWKAHRTFQLENLKEQIAGTIWLEEIPALDISATQIRHIIATGKNPRYLLPLAVLEIINKNQLYR
jgi:nicotinate-nucleotide adenylyltransferase